MPVNKNALIRYKLLDKCFSNKWKRYYINDLIKHCSDALSEYYGKDFEVSRRQILNDIDFMRCEIGYSAPIQSLKDGRKVYYRYNPINFTISNQPLNPDEEQQIKLAIETLGRIKGIPQLAWINAVQTKLSAGFNLDESPTPVISFQENEFLKGLSFLEPLYQFIVHRQVILVTYKGYKQEVFEEHEIHPYYLKQYNNRWFLYGWNAAVQRIQNLALDRFLEINQYNKAYVENTIDFEEYFEDIIGVTNFSNRVVQDVIIRLAEAIIPYVNSKPLHGSQKIKENVLILQLKLNYELESLILSFGENMEVLAPKELKEKIQERIKSMGNSYLCS